MANDNNQQARRHRFLMLCLYVAAYATLRYHGEVVVQNVNMPTQFGIQTQQMVSAHPNLPYWRQQLYRAVFSLPMVIEEQGNRAARSAQGAAYGAAQGATGGNNMYAPRQQYAPQQQYAPPQQQYAQTPRRRQASGGDAGLAPGEKLIYVAPPNGGAGTTASRR